MRYYDPDRDNPVNGTYFTSELLAMLRDLTQRESSDEPIDLSPEGLVGLNGLLNMMQGCLRDISRQLYDERFWETAAVLNGYLQAHPEAEAELRQLLSQARDRGFTGWGEIPLE